MTGLFSQADPETERKTIAQKMPLQFYIDLLRTFSHHMEANVARVISFDKGSKRRLRQIRWKRLEVVSLGLLFLVTMITIALALVWMVSHFSDEPRTPHLQDQRSSVLFGDETTISFE